MTRLLLICMLLTSCMASPASTPEAQFGIYLDIPVNRDPERWNKVIVVPDKQRSVTCWVVVGGFNGTNQAISCLPDSQVGGKDD